MPKILFSIIIPTYNRADFIVKTIQSVLNQTYTNFEVIVVDDGSTDNTKKIVATLNDNRIIYYNKENEERGTARNYGTKKAKGNYVSFLDSDDLLYPNYLDEACSFIQKHSNILIFHQLFEVRNSNNDLIQKAGFKSKNIFIDLIKKGNFLACQGMFLKFDFALENLFIEDRNLSGSEDYELWLRISANNSIIINPIVTSILIDHDERSVINIDAEKLIIRKELMLKYLFENTSINTKILNFKKEIITGAYSYIALHLALTKTKKPKAFKYLLKTLSISPVFLLNKRFFAIVKHLIF